jgi:hypothetical protein
MKCEIRGRNEDGRQAIVITLPRGSVRTAHQGMQAEITLAT